MERRRIGFFGLLTAMLLAGCATHSSLKTVYYELPIDPPYKEQSKGQRINIVLISDLHSDIYGKDQTPLLQRIYSEAPDIIVLSGDIFDDKTPHLGSRLLLAGIKQDLPEIPVFYVTGNHEYDGGKINEILKEISDFGVIFLSDDYAAIEVKGVNIVVAGVEDPNKKLWDPFYHRAFADSRFKQATAIDAYKILICHRPEIVKYYTEYGFDLVLSGHTHGGQVRLPPLINGLYAPGQGLFPKYSGGVYKIEDLSLVVSRGLTTRRPLLPRIFNPPELVVIRLDGYN